MYRVKFMFLSEGTKEESDYNSLFDAIRVAKETNVGPDRLFISAMSDSSFNENFLTLLTSGFVYCGRKTAEYPEGDVMLMLLKVSDDSRQLETPVLPGVVMPIPMPGAEMYKFPLQLIKNEELEKEANQMAGWTRLFTGDQNPETD